MLGRVAISGSPLVWLAARIHLLKSRWVNYLRCLLHGAGILGRSVNTVMMPPHKSSPIYGFDLCNNRSISVIGLGYVGLPVAVAFGRSKRTLGFDINATRISELQQGEDRTFEVSEADLAATDIVYSCNPEDLKQADFHIIAESPLPSMKPNSRICAPSSAPPGTLAPQLKRATSLC